jgi:hypothetical protein
MKDQIMLAALLGLISGPTFAADYPAYVTAKKLYATTDFRGKQAPALSVQQWLSGAPPQTAGKVVLGVFPGSSEDPLTEQTIAQIIEASKNH